MKYSRSLEAFLPKNTKFRHLNSETSPQLLIWLTVPSPKKTIWREIIQSDCKLENLHVQLVKSFRITHLAHSVAPGGLWLIYIHGAPPPFSSSLLFSDLDPSLSSMNMGQKMPDLEEGRKEERGGRKEGEKGKKGGRQANIITRSVIYISPEPAAQIWASILFSTEAEKTAVSENTVSMKGPLPGYKDLAQDSHSSSPGIKLLQAELFQDYFIHKTTLTKLY